MCVLVSAAVDCGAGGVRSVHRPNMMTSRFGVLGPLASPLVRAEMLLQCAGPALNVGAMLVLASVARNRRAGSEWVAWAANLHVLVQG